VRGARLIASWQRRGSIQKFSPRSSRRAPLGTYTPQLRLSTLDKPITLAGIFTGIARGLDSGYPSDAVLFEAEL
jgi:hypothetical protein